MKKKLLSLSLVAGFLMTIMSGTMAFAVNADENANVLTAENAVIVEKTVSRVLFLLQKPKNFLLTDRKLKPYCYMSRNRLSTTKAL